MADLRITQVAVETLTPQAATPAFRVTQVSAETLTPQALTPAFRFTQVAVETLSPRTIPQTGVGVESISVGESVQRQFQTVRSRAANEPVNVLESVTALLLGSYTRVDLVSAVDAIKAVILFVPGLNVEPVTVVEAVQAVVSPLTVRAQETVSLADVFTVGNLLSVSVAETITVVERFRYPYHRKVIEYITVTDQSTGTPTIRVPILLVVVSEVIDAAESPVNLGGAGQGGNPTPGAGELGPPPTPIAVQGDYWVLGI